MLTHIHISIFFNTSLLHISLPSFSLFSWQMNLLMRRYLDLKLWKRRIWTLCAVGFKLGAPCLTGGRGMGASARSEFISFPSFGFYVTLYFFSHSYPCIFSIFQGLDLLKNVGTLWEEAQKLEMEAAFGG